MYLKCFVQPLNLTSVKIVASISPAPNCVAFVFAPMGCSAPTRPYFRDFFPNRDFLEKVVPIQSLFQELVPIPKNRAKNYQKLTKLGPKCHFLTLKSIFSSLTRDFFQSIHFTILNKLFQLVGVLVCNVPNTIYYLAKMGLYFLYNENCKS